MPESRVRERAGILPAVRDVRQLGRMFTPIPEIIRREAPVPAETAISARTTGREPAAVPAEEIRGKESRERDNNRRKKHDRDVLGSKKQERYVNLEKNGGKKKNKAPAPKAAC